MNKPATTIINEEKNISRPLGQNSQPENGCRQIRKNSVHPAWYFNRNKKNVRHVQPKKKTKMDHISNMKNGNQNQNQWQQPVNRGNWRWVK